jgi:uncharacterized protein (TIGR01244 family)
MRSIDELKENLMKLLRILTVVALLLSAIPVLAQEAHEHERTREPAHIISPEQAGILLMEGRVELEQPDKTLDFMGLKDGDVVADIGAGNGFYTLRLAERVAPSGKIYAQDIQQGMLDQLGERAEEAGAENIEMILGSATETNLPDASVDWVLLVDVYHEFSEPEAMLESIKKCLKPGGKVLLLEYRAEQTDDVMPVFIPRDHKMTVEEVMSEWTAAGFALVERREFLPAQHLFVFQPSDSEASAPAWDLMSRIYPIEIGDVLNPATFGNFVHFAGQPDPEEFKAYADMGVATVLNLRTGPEVEGLEFDQAEAVKEAGMNYEHVGIRGEPTKEQLDKIFKIIEDHEKENKPLLLHCGSSNRVGYIWSMYRGTRHGLSADEAIAEGKAAGLRVPELEEHARKVIEENK